MPAYEWNPEAADLGALIIQEHHPHLEKLKIAYLFKHGAESKPGKVIRAGKRKTWAKASLIPEKYVELLEANYKFLIEFDVHVWSQLSKPQQRALVDHEFCHCGNDIDGCYMKHHDVEEFRDVINRHGFWKDDVKAFAQACASMPLFDQAEKQEKKPEKGSGEAETVTFSTPGHEPVTITGSELKNMARSLGKKGVAGKPKRQPRIGRQL